MLRKGKFAQQKKLDVQVVGTSNIRDCSSKLNNNTVHGLVWLSGGRDFQNMIPVIKNIMAVNNDTDCLVVHLGTNDVLQRRGEAQTRLVVSDALEETRQVAGDKPV